MKTRRDSSSSIYLSLLKLWADWWQLKSKEIQSANKCGLINLLILLNSNLIEYFPNPLELLNLSVKWRVHKNVKKGEGNWTNLLSIALKMDNPIFYYQSTSQKYTENLFSQEYCCYSSIHGSIFSSNQDLQAHNVFFLLLLLLSFLRAVSCISFLLASHPH